jgi:hypothetical protein
VTPDELAAMASPSPAPEQTLIMSTTLAPDPWELATEDLITILGDAHDEEECDNLADLIEEVRAEFDRLRTALKRRGWLRRFLHSGVLPFTAIHPDHPDYPR